MSITLGGDSNIGNIMSGREKISEGSNGVFGTNSYEDVVQPLLGQAESKYAEIQTMLNGDDAATDPLISAKLALATQLMEGMVEGATAVSSAMANMIKNSEQKIQ